jgi:hypothetical protein
MDIALWGRSRWEIPQLKPEANVDLLRLNITKTNSVVVVAGRDGIMTNAEGTINSYPLNLWVQVSLTNLGMITFLSDFGHDCTFYFLHEGAIDLAIKSRRRLERLTNVKMPLVPTPLSRVEEFIAGWYVVEESKRVYVWILVCFFL